MKESTGRRRSKRPARIVGAVHQQEWRSVVNPYSPIEVLSEDQIGMIHEASMTILEEIGMDFLLPKAREILLEAGADVDADSERVRFDRVLIEKSIATIPKRFTLHARNPAHDLEFGGNSINFAAVASAPNVSDMEGGRRVGNYKDFCNLLRLSQSLNVVHFNGGYPVEPVDLHPSVRHLDALQACATLTDKCFHAYSTGHGRILDGLEIARIARGISREQLMREPSLFTIINSSSPLRLDSPMLDGIIQMSSMNQVVVLTPFTLSGAMAPATLAGALAQQNAEALAGLAFTQIIKPGAPAMYGGFTSNVDMKSGAPAFGTPEYSRAALAGGQLARHYGIPYRSSNANAANTLDAQCAYESEMSLWAAAMGHANMVMHGAGWMEGGLCASFEKMIIDAELLQMMAEFLKPIEVNEETLALDAMRDVGPGGHFFGTAHTLDRYETAFYPPMVSDWRNYESWEEAGSPTAADRANKIYKQLLHEYETPAINVAVAEELEAFVAKRKEEGGVEAD